MTKNKSHLLIDEPPLLVLPTLATLIGLNEAIVLQQVHWWVGLNRQANKDYVYQDGKWWTFSTFEEWQQNNFPFWSVATVKRVFKVLENKVKDNQGNIIRTPLIITGNYNKTTRDRTKWYRVDYDALNAISDDAEYQLDTMSLYQGDTLESSNVTRSYNKETKRDQTKESKPSLGKVVKPDNGASPNISPDVVESLIETWLAHNVVLDGAPMSRGNKKHFTTLARSGITPQQLGGFMHWKREQRGWSKKNVPVAFIVDEIGEYLEQAQATPDTYTESELNAMLAQYERTSRND